MTKTIMELYAAKITEIVRKESVEIFVENVDDENDQTKASKEDVDKIAKKHKLDPFETHLLHGWHKQYKGTSYNTREEMHNLAKSKSVKGHSLEHMDSFHRDHENDARQKAWWKNHNKSFKG